MSNTPATAAATSEPWAEVRACDRVMRYRRSGAGSTVLLLGADALSSPLSTDIVAALGMRFRVIVPDAPVGASMTAWISEFLEGLGTCEVAILAADHLCMPAIELVFRGVDQIKRLVLIPDGEPARDTTERSITSAIGTPPIPVLILRPGLGVAETLPLVTSFLAGA
ncbi:MAG TPA: hypothetical protein VGM82_08630 [Gemmatimonadaceae bacterium]|jgi:hypothetical protein